MGWRLYINLGNTNLHWGAHSAGGWIAQARFPTALLGLRTIHAHLERPLEDAGLSLAEMESIVAVASHPEGLPALEQCMESSCGHPVLLVGRDIAPDIVVEYHEPQRIGIDRVVNAYAAREIHGAPCVVLDFGTCLTAEAVSGDGRLVGGAIAAGLPVTQAGLGELVPRLRRPFDKAVKQAPAEGPGRDTEENLRIGCVGGLAAVADWLIERARGWVGHDARAVLTGGDAALIAPICRNAVVQDQMLGLEGLRLLEAAAWPK